MSTVEAETETQHAMLVVWGQFAQALGLIQALNSIPLHQKKVRHAPHTKILEFFLAVLAGLEHLQDLSTAAEPIEKDLSVARAWLQPAWADYSGVSRTLSALSQAEAEQLVQVLDQISQPFIHREVMLSLARSGYLVLDGDLTPLPVSNTSTTYPEAAYGHMDDQLRLGYQVAKVALCSHSYGRLMLASTIHPGDVVSCTQTRSLVGMAEKQLGFRPRRRTDLLAERLKTQREESQKRSERYPLTWKALQKATSQLPETRQKIQACQEQLEAAEQAYQQQNRAIKPFSQPGKLRSRLGTLQRQIERLEKKIPDLDEQLAYRHKHLMHALAEENELQQRLKQYEQDNATNPFPVQVVFRIDAGFGTADNIAWLIEMGYDLYTRPYGDWLKPRLKRLAENLTTWTRVGNNAEMIVWQEMQLEDFPYPLNIGLERFYTGATQRYSAMLHFGADPVTTDPEGWFTFYNAGKRWKQASRKGSVPLRCTI